MKCQVLSHGLNSEPAPADPAEGIPGDVSFAVEAPLENARRLGGGSSRRDLAGAKHAAAARLRRDDRPLNELIRRYYARFVAAALPVAFIIALLALPSLSALS